MARPREYDDDLRIRLLVAAARLLTDEGPHALTTRRIATEAGTSTSAIYSLIGSKDELIRAMHREGFERLSAAFAEVARTDDPINDLIGLGAAYHQMATANPQLYRVMFDCPLPEFVPNAGDAQTASASLQSLIEAVQRCLDAGVIDGDVWDIALSLWALSHGFAGLDAQGVLGSPDESRRRLRQASTAALDGYRTATITR